MDSAVVFLGRNHRILFHDSFSAVAIARECYPGDPNAVNAALAHIQLDQLCSRDPNLKMILECLGMLDRKKRKSGRKQAPKTDDTVAKVLRDMKKIEEIRGLHRLFYSR
jgi:hypothetical protein